MDKRVAILSASVCGVAFSFSFTGFQCIALIVFPIAFSQTRRNAIMTITAFYAVAAIPSITVAYAYTESPLFSLMPYVALVVVNALPLSFAFYQKMIPSFISVPVALALVSIPPLAQLNPLTLIPLAGWVFPSFGILGIIMLLTTIAISCTAKRLGIFGFLGICAVLLPYGLSHADPHIQDNVSAISLSRPYDKSIRSSIMRGAYRHEELDLINKVESDIVVLPESIFGVWQPIDSEILGASVKTIYGGSRVYIDEHRYKNVVVNAKNGNVVYEQVNPPRFITNRNAMAVGGNGEIQQTEIAWLICYEITNSWLVYQRMHNSLDTTVWLSNISWIKTSYFKNRLNSLQAAWSRLYSQPIHTAMMSHD